MAGSIARHPFKIGTLLLLLVAVVVTLMVAQVAIFTDDNGGEDNGQLDAVTAGAVVEETDSGPEAQVSLPPSPAAQETGTIASGSAPFTTTPAAILAATTSTPLSIFPSENPYPARNNTEPYRPTPPAPESVGSLTGLVEGEEAAPISGIYVYLAGEDGNLIGTYVVTGTDGRFSFTGLAPGAYKLYFSDQAGYYESGWYGGGPVPGGAPISVAAGMATDVIYTMYRASNPLNGVIAGRVTNAAGDAVSGVVVSAYNVDPGSGTQLTLEGTAVCGINGYYRINNLPPGDYKVSFDPPGDAYSFQWYQGQSTHAGAKIIPVPPGSTIDDINAVLEGGGTIAGVVTADGQALQLARVDIFDNTGVIVDSRLTNGQGGYQSSLLPAGSYRIRVTSPSRDYVNEWYNDKPNFAAADGVSVLSGQQSTGINIDLSAAVPATINSPPDDGSSSPGSPYPGDPQRPGQSPAPGTPGTATPPAAPGSSAGSGSDDEGEGEQGAEEPVGQPPMEEPDPGGPAVGPSGNDNAAAGDDALIANEQDKQVIGQGGYDQAAAGRMQG